KYLGEQFDIHGGGMDLKFPHHECEIAQGTGANGKAPVHYWIHSNMLTVNGQKMSKSLGNSFLPSELFSGSHPMLQRGYTPMAVRFFMLQSHYSSTLDFSNEALQAAEKGYKKLSSALKTLRELSHPGTSMPDPSANESLQSLVQTCYKEMSDDFNTAKTLAVLFEMASRINDMKSGNLPLTNLEAENFASFANAYTGFMENVLGLKEESGSDETLLDGTIGVLIGLRKKARADRNFALSDKIRDELKSIGIQLKDGKDGEITWSAE
ncbi:MAG: class I tRNA ligase family protein, partial [Bacteroidetes bacterium]|nr:class I tRNA ligase family protein [Bacteroidota bacterium]